jgi:ATP-dependent HslUV protease subunit HslV
MALMEQYHGTTILGVKKDGRTVIAGDGQVSLGNTVIKPNAKKVRRLGEDGTVIGGFAGATADAFTLFERLENKLEQYNGQLLRAAVELAKDWRMDKYLRNLEAMMIVADKESMLILTGNATCSSPRAGSPRSVRAAITRWPPHGRWRITSPTRKSSPGGRWRSPRKCACSPTTS